MLQTARAAAAWLGSAAAAMGLGPTLPSDSCAGSQLIPLEAGQQLVLAGDASLFTDDAGLPACDMTPPRDSGAAGAWYRLIGTGNRISIDACSGPSLDLVLRVFCGGCATPLCAAADDDGCDGGATLNPRLAFCSQAGVEYLLLLSRFGTAPGGPFALTVADNALPCATPPACGQPPPANDTCAGALPIAMGAGAVGTTIDATSDASVSLCAGGAARSGLWYTFTGNGRLCQATTCDPLTGSNTSLSVYSGSCGQLVCVAGGAANPACAERTDAATTATFCTAIGVAYFILVSDDVDGAGLFRLNLVDHGFTTCTPAGACCVAGACSITAAAACTGTYLGDGTVCGSSTWPNLPIPDNNTAGLASSLNIPSPAGPITDLNVSVVINHTWQGDLTVTLQHESGPEVTLINRPGFPQTSFGFSADNFGNPGGGTPFIVDDQALPARTYDLPQILVPGTNNPTGSWLPDTGPLSAFNGQSLAGTWTLRVRDLATQDTGTLRAWGLIPTPSPLSPCAVPVADCFSRLVNGLPPLNAGHFTRGLPDGVGDSTQCVADWDRNGTVQPADVAEYVTAWFYSVSNPGNLDADIDCSGGVLPADVAAFVSRWFAGVSAPGSEGC